MSDCDIRPMHDDEFNKVQALYKAAFHKEINPVYWQWKYHENPHGRTVRMVAVAGDRLVGFYGLIPRKFMVDGQVLVGHQETDLMVHPEWRGIKIFRSMGLACYRRLMEDGYTFTFGFPNQQSTPAGTKVLGWELVCPMPIWNRYLRPGYILRRKGIPLVPGMIDGAVGVVGSLTGRSGRYKDIAIVDRLPGDPARLETAPTQDSMIRGLRDAAYLQWRYRQPVDTPYLFAVKGDESAPAGLAVFRIMPGEPREAWVLELIGPNRAVTSELLAAVTEACRQRRVEVIRLWLLEGGAASRTPPGTGYKLRPTTIHHVIRPLEDAHVNSLIRRAGNWSITIGDSDCV
ncbi:GNAT family N-acetyltransferase [bacterium]|nr:GNAT family N-acetyltransferase [candidate division CSSED10-310 bacterium]